MRYKESLLFLLPGSTLQRMIMEFMIFSTSIPSKEVHSAHSNEDKDMLKTYYFKILCLVISWGSIFSMCFFLFPHFSGHNKLLKGEHSLVVGPYKHPYFLTYNHKFRLRLGCWNILNPLITYDKIINHYLINYSPTSLISWHPLAP